MLLNPVYSYWNRITLALQQQSMRSLPKGITALFLVLGSSHICYSLLISHQNTTWDPGHFCSCTRMRTHTQKMVKLQAPWRRDCVLLEYMGVHANT